MSETMHDIHDEKQSLVNWSNIRVVIFDVDGTLYDQHRLRIAMMRDLIRYYFFKPFELKDIFILSCFRKVREEIADSGLIRDIENSQYKITAERLKLSEKAVRSCVKKWILNHPLAIIEKYRFPYLKEFCSFLRSKDILLVTFSDYPSKDKLLALKLPQMYTVCSTDKNTDAMKPDPKGLHQIINKFGVTEGACLFIGDRDDRDGECARRAGIKYMLKARRRLKADTFECYSHLLQDIKESIKN